MKSVTIHIPEPCHENWEAMTPTEKGRFCSFCTKEVVDFSSMSDAEVLNYLIHKKNEPVCGRVLPSQMNREISKPMTFTKKVAWYWRYMVAALLLFAKLPGKAQKVKVNVGKAHSYHSHSSYEIGKMAAPRVDTIVTEIYKGRIMDEKGNGIPGATITLTNDAQIKATTDKDGRFNIVIPKNTAKKILISALGYESKELLLKKNAKKNMVKLKQELSFLGEIVSFDND